MLQKLENAYLAILRFVILLVAGLLLVGVGIYGFGGLKALKQEPELEAVTPKVSAATVIKEVAATKSEQSVDSSQPVSASSPLADPFAPYYERMVKAIRVFVAKTAPDVTLVQKDELIQILKNNEKQAKSPEWTAEYVKGLAEVLEAALVTPEAIKAAKTKHAFKVIDGVITTYTEHFNSQIDEKNAANATKVAAHEQDKAEGMQNLYIAGGAFGAFLVIIFLSIIIRIERNLRNLERLEKVAPMVEKSVEPSVSGAAP